MLRFLPIIVLLFCIHLVSQAQVKIGGGSASQVDPAAVLELSNNLSNAPANWRTFLPPQVDFTNEAFINAGVWGVSGSPVNGAVVYNVGTAYNNGFNGPGLYCWMGNRWTSFTMGNQDNIRRALSSSLQAYDTAVDNSWIMVTEPEYNNLLFMLAGAAKYAANDSFMNLSATNGWNQLYTVGGNAAVTQIPPSSYIVAWSVRTGLPYPSNAANSKLKISTMQLTGYTDYGSPLPDYSLTTDTRYYFILKKPLSATPPMPCYTAVYAFHAKFLGNRPTSTNRDYFTPGESSTLSNGYASQSSAQFICTPLRQW